LSGWLLTLDGLSGLRGWQWLYIIEGLPAVLLAPLALVLIQDGPAKAKWLTGAERSRLERILAAEKTQVESKRTYSIRQALLDPQVMFLSAVYFTNVCLLNGVTFFLPQIVKGFGYSTIQTGLIVATPSAAAFFALIWWGRRSDARKERYGHAALANLVGGAALLAAIVLTDPVARIVALTVAFAATLAFTAPFWAIPGAFLTGAAAAGGIATISALGVVGGFLSPWVIGRLHDLTGDFRVGLGLAAVRARAIPARFYWIGRAKRGRPQASAA
jgi:MFS family permease